MFAVTIAMSAQTDSIRTEILPEVVVNADGQIETAEKTVLLPKALEKKHAVNAYDLLSVMQTAELEVSTQAKSITTHNGGEVAICINGVEALPEDLATLRARNIRSIEYIRTPSGKYAGKAGLVNFITVKMAYGGNVLLSGSQGFAYKQGEYLAFADFTKKGLTLSLTASGDWSRDHSYTEGKEDFLFADNSRLSRDITSESSLRKSNNQAIRLKLASTGKKHRLNTYVALYRQAQPSSESWDRMIYTGFYNGSTQRKTATDSRNLQPTVYANYTLWLPKSQTLDFTAQASFGHNKYHSLYSETAQTDLVSDVTEDNQILQGGASYYKTLKGNVTLAASLNHDHNHYKDAYAGSADGHQWLTTDVTTGLLQVSQTWKDLYYYASAGVSNSAVSLNDTHYNYCSPVAFYGANYALSQKHALSLSGLFTHTLFDPSIKNSMLLRRSFFEAVKGNPDISPMKVLSNTLTYSGQFGKSRLSVSYQSSMYFDNILHQYTTDNNTLYDMRINDGKFIGNMFSSTYTYRAFSDKLRLSLTAIEEYNMLRGDVYDESKNIFRMEASATWLTGDWMLRFGYRTPYTVLDIREPYLIHRQPVYEFQASWNHGNWALEALVRNPFNRYGDNHVTMDYGCMKRDIHNYSEPDGRNVNLKATWSFGYGKKHECSDANIDNSINSAILKTY